MKIQLLYASHKPPAWADDAVQDYAKRFPKHFQWQEYRFTPSTPSEEFSIFMSKISPRAWVVLLDVSGKLMTTEAFSRQWESWQHLGKDLVFVIGGPDGFDERMRTRADARISLSPMTFPHALARVMCVEQLYRAWTLLEGHPYHRP